MVTSLEVDVFNMGHLPATDVQIMVDAAGWDDGRNQSIGTYTIMLKQII